MEKIDMDIEAAAKQITGPCACHESYTDRWMIDPNCRFHDFHADIVDVIRRARNDMVQLCINMANLHASKCKGSSCCGAMAYELMILKQPVHIG